MTSQVKDKDGKAIKEGETVSGKIRGGKHVGEVDQVVVSKEEAAEKGVKNPPKVLFTDQHGLVLTITFIDFRSSCPKKSGILGPWIRS